MLVWQQDLCALFHCVILCVPLMFRLRISSRSVFRGQMHLGNLANRTDDARYQIPRAVTDGCSVLRNWKFGIIIKHYSSAYLFTCHEAHKEFYYYKDCINTGKKAYGIQTKARAISLLPLHLRTSRADVETFANCAPHNMRFSTDQWWFCIRDCQVQIQDGTTDISIERFCVILTFSWQMPRYFLMRPSIVASRLAVHTGFRMDFCTCARFWTPRWCCALFIDWSIFIISLHDVFEIDASPSFCHTKSFLYCLYYWEQSFFF